ncbi:hypothetical protein OFS07_07055 [Brachyspira hyodysenteriae]|uniref:hypothetical protein n=1 Tax=Brachyspira hyodysenteriae TaxID=159 RepID=UPI00063DC8E7|nr:hypothetical protein [Brachyspira hyodysenteriae]KLI31789.1 hypothetical protein SZ49_02705 [Brachyspira hyodysenteriae]MDA0062267.1 hypothetical protein [Brachyspira hyodysenteriae]MDA0066031.1 hypothetical protein [Brachyspira hyodysenteriae]MDA0071121.1 hypothetical protein [Brachyspira hyodysenteriae]MDA0088996.1 hypothetical protein [Brachyspira hyodysenteriae]
MKKIIFLLIIFFVLITFIISCGNYFNPRYYYNNRGSSVSGDIPDNPDIGGGGENLSPEDDPFDPSGGKDWNDPNYGGFNLNLDNLVIRADFDGNNRPSYRFEEGSWAVNDPAKNSYKNGGKLSCKAGSFSINDVTYYLYKGKNPAFDPNSSYNKSDRLKRFYFYHLIGSSAGNVVDNYLICIDSYSKLVFAFGVPIKWKSVIIKDMPIAWGSVELGWEADSSSNNPIYFNNTYGVKYFYEYDPVGVVLSDKTIKIFDWCLDSIAKNRYAPRVKNNVIDLKRPIASAIETEGRSPYMPIKVDEKLSMTVTAEQIQIQNVDVVSANYFFGGIDYKKGLAGISYDIRFGYNTSSGVMDNFETINKFDKTTLFSGLFSVKVGETKTITSTPKELKIEYTEKEDIYLLLDANVTVYSSGNVWTSEWPSAMIDTQKPIVKLKYDKSKDAFVFDSIYGDNADRIIEYTTGFELTKGSSKDFTITFKSTEIGEEKKTGTMKLIYRLKY